MGQIHPPLRATNSQKVRENALRRVVMMTVLLVSVPSCPMDFAITKELTVVADPSIMRMATSF